jgi:hypothetical protein
VDHRRGGRGAGRLIRARALLALLAFAWAAPARGQAFDSVGIRAQGMGGAFVAVADDATAVWWNPAGLAGGALFSAIIEHQDVSRPDDEDAAGRAGQPFTSDRTTGFAIAYPALGVSYYHLRIRQETNPTSTDTPSSDRQDQGSAGVSLGALSLSQYGITVGQSVGDHLVVSTTLKLLRGDAAFDVVPAGEGSAARADALDAAGETHADLDLGVMVRAGLVKVGVAARNLRSPEFGDGNGRLELKRRVRAGVSVSVPLRRIVNAVTVAADADVTTNESPFGEDRQVAVGAEAWLLGSHVGVRGGLTARTAGSAPRSLSGGVSVTLARGVFLDGFIVGGDDTGRTGWGSDLRLTY